MMTTTWTVFFFLLQVVAHASTSYGRYDKCSSSATGCLGTTWKSNGKTVAGGNGQGNALNQLDSAYGLFVHSNGTLFIADYNNHRVLKWEQDASSGMVWAQGQCGTGEQGQICSPSAITFDKENTLFVSVEDGGKGELIRWRKGATSGETIISANSTFYGIALDREEEYLYLGHHREHSVVKYTKDGAFVSVVAGDNGPGDALNQLNFPRGVAVDGNGSVYVTDSSNHRVMKWTVNATAGIIVGGGNGVGNRTDQLTKPGGIIVDETGTIYVADEDNHRVVSVPMTTRNGTVIAGGHGQGNAPNQLSFLASLAFNTEGELFVSDFNNFRVQMFATGTDPSRGSVSAYVCTPSRKWTLVSCFLPLMLSIASLLK